MKIKTTIITTIFACLFMLCLTSCSTDTMRSTDSFMRNTARNTRNTIDRGINAVENGFDNSMNNTTNRVYGADGGYSNYSAAGRDSMTGITGRTTTRNTSRTNTSRDMLPSLASKSRDNYGQINTNNGRSDGGKGDIFSDMDTRRNTLGTDTFK